MRKFIYFCLLFPLFADAAPETVRGSSGRRSRNRTEVNCHIAAAGRMTLSAIYGTCQAGQTMLPNASNERLPEDGVCAGTSSSDRDLRGLQSLYNRRERNCGASKPPQYSQSAPRMTYQRGVIDPAPNGKNDCSAFVSSILHASGSRIRPNETSFKAYTTASIVGWGDGDDCFAIPKFTESTSLLPGDLIVGRRGRHGHVVMVDRVGADPFGLRKIGSIRQCEQQPNFRDWDFTITESTGKTVNKRKIGPSIWDIKGSFRASSRANANHIVRAYMDLWKSACREKFGTSATTKFSSGNYRSRLLRYQGASRAQCRNSNPPKLRGEQCVQSCKI